MLFLSFKPTCSNKKPTEHILFNGATHVMCNRLKHVMESAAEAEVGRLFTNHQELLLIKTYFEEMGHF